MSTVTLEDKVQKLIDDWVLKCIMGDIEQFLKLPKGGNYPVATLLFSVIDLMGGLLNGNVKANNTKNMKDFMREYMRRVDSRYTDLAVLLIDMFRHPLAHMTTSRSYSLGSQTLRSGIYWEEDVAHRGELIQLRKCHFVRSQYQGKDTLVINDHVLFEDLKSATKLYRDDLLAGKIQKLRDYFEKAYNDLTSPKVGSKFASEIRTVQSWPYTEEKCFGP